MHHPRRPSADNSIKSNYEKRIVQPSDLTSLRRLLDCTAEIWYLPYVSREEATLLLTPADAGNFIVRQSSSREEDLALTVRGVDSCLHFTIVVRDTHFAVSTSRNEFPTLTELILFYSNSETDMSVVLAMPNFLFSSSSIQLQCYSNMKEGFWKNYRHIKSEAMHVFQSISTSTNPPALPQRRRGSECPHSPSPAPLPPPTISDEQDPRSLSLDDLRIPFQPSSVYHNFIRPLHSSSQTPHLERHSPNVFFNGHLEDEKEAITRRSVSNSLERLSQNTTPSPASVYDCLWRHSQAPATVENLRNDLKYDELPSLIPPLVHSSLMQLPSTGIITNTVPRSPKLNQIPSGSSKYEEETPMSYYDNYPKPNKDATIYCTPWDQGSIISKAVSQLRSVIQTTGFQEDSIRRSRSVPSNENSDGLSVAGTSSTLDEDQDDCISPFVDNRIILNRRIGEDIRKFIQELVLEESSLFCKSIHLFIKCTLESSTTDPDIIMRNMRQFLTGLRNYLLSSEKIRLNAAVNKELPKLRRGEFLNVETIFECVLGRIVIKPLKDFLYRLIYDKHTSNDSLRIFTSGVNLARSKTPLELGVKRDTRLPQTGEMDGIRKCLQRMTESYSPLKKLECLLKAAEIMYRSIMLGKKTMDGNDSQIGADDFLPVFVYCICQCRLLEAPLEADFMQGLLGPSILRGEAAYYLTSTQAAIEVIKSLVERVNNAIPEDISQRGTIEVFILDDVNDSVIPKVFPLRQWSTVRDLCNMIAHAMNIFNPLDYSLFYYVDNEEKVLVDSEYPMQVKSASQSVRKKSCVFVYKRTHSFIVMPARCAAATAM